MKIASERKSMPLFSCRRWSKHPSIQERSLKCIINLLPHYCCVKVQRGETNNRLANVWLIFTAVLWDFMLVYATKLWGASEHHAFLNFLMVLSANLFFSHLFLFFLYFRVVFQPFVKQSILNVAHLNSSNNQNVL